MTLISSSRYFCKKLASKVYEDVNNYTSISSQAAIDNMHISKLYIEKVLLPHW